MNDKLTELKPCPFCGGVSEFLEGGLLITNGIRLIKVRCSICSTDQPIYYMSKSDATDAWNRRTPAETVSLEKIADTFFCKSPLVSESEVGPFRKALEAIYALQLPAHQPVSTGAVTPAMVHAAICKGWDSVPGQDDFADPETVGYQTKAVMELLASRSSVPSVVGVPSVDRWETYTPRFTEDTDFRKSEVGEWVKYHDIANLLTRQPDLTAVVEALESISRIENGVESDMKRVDMCVRIARKALANKGDE